MRLATCVGLTGTVTVVGSRATVQIDPGWQGDLDQVIGESDGQLETIANHLGPELLSKFDDVTPAPTPSEE